MSLYLPVFNLGLVYAQSHSRKSERELLRGKTTALAAERKKTWIFSNPPLPMDKTTALNPTSLLLDGSGSYWAVIRN